MDWINTITCQWGPNGDVIIVTSFIRTHIIRTLCSVPSLFLLERFDYTAVRVTPGGPAVFESQWNESKYNSCLSCRLSRFWFEFNPAEWLVVLSRWCCCNVKNQKKISTKSFTFREYETRILRVQLTQLDDQRAPGVASMMSFYY